MASERDAWFIERLVDRQVLPGGTYLSYVRDTVITEDGRRSSRDVVLHPGAVAVVAVRPDRRLLLVRQYRHPAGEVLLELPAGTLDTVDDGSVEEPLPAAKRELFEETGHRAATWRHLSDFYSAPGFATELMHLYLATNATLDPSYEGPEPDERLELVTPTFEEALTLAGDGTIRDAKTLIGLYALERLVRAGEMLELSGRT